MQKIQWTMRTTTLFFLAALSFLNGFLFFNVFSALAGSSLLLFLLYSKLSFERDLGEIQSTRRVLETILYVNHPCHVKTELWHTGNPVLLTINETSPSVATKSQENNKNQFITIPGTPLKFTYQLTFHSRGRHRFPPIEVTINDRMHLFSTTRQISTDTQVMVQSDPLEMQKAKRASLSEDDALLLPSLVGSEESMEFEGIRESLPGDLLRSIDWKTSSRLQMLVTKIFEKKETLESTIFLDVSRNMRRSMGKHTKLDHAIAIVLQLTLMLQKLHHRVGFVAFDEHKVITRVPSTFDYQSMYTACTDLPSSVPTSSYVPSFPEESDPIIVDEPAEHQRFLSTISPFISQTGKPAKNRLHTTGIFQAVNPFLSKAKKSHLIVLTDLETQRDALYASMTLAHAHHHKQWLLTLFSPGYINQNTKNFNVEYIEHLYKWEQARDRLLQNLRKKQVEIVHLAPTMQGMHVMQTIKRKR